jgi:hypothetical protein
MGQEVESSPHWNDPVIREQMIFVRTSKKRLGACYEQAASSFANLRK